MKDYIMDYEFDEFPYDGEDEELDLPKTGNGAKSVAPLHIYKILEENSSAGRPLHIKDIVDILADYPYGLVIERKAVSRHLCTIMLCYSEIHYDKRIGAWFEAQRPYRAA